MLLNLSSCASCTNALWFNKISDQRRRGRSEWFITSFRAFCPWSKYLKKILKFSKSSLNNLHFFSVQIFIGVSHLIKRWNRKRARALCRSNDKERVTGVFYLTQMDWRIYLNYSMSFIIIDLFIMFVNDDDYLNSFIISSTNIFIFLLKH